MLLVLSICCSPRVWPSVLSCQGGAVELLLEKNISSVGVQVQHNILGISFKHFRHNFTWRQDFCSLTQSAPASAAAAIIFLASLTSPCVEEDTLPEHCMDILDLVFSSRWY